MDIHIVLEVDERLKVCDTDEELKHKFGNLCEQIENIKMTLLDTKTIKNGVTSILTPILTKFVDVICFDSLFRVELGDVKVSLTEARMMTVEVPIRPCKVYFSI